MKRTFLFPVLLLWLVCIAGQVAANTVSKSDSLSFNIEEAIEEGSRQLTTLIEQNQIHFKNGEFDKLSYVFGKAVGGDPTVKRSYDAVLNANTELSSLYGQRNHNVLSNGDLSALEGKLREVNLSLANLGKPQIYIGLDGFLGKIVVTQKMPSNITDSDEFQRILSGRVPFQKDTINYDKVRGFFNKIYYEIFEKVKANNSSGDYLGAVIAYGQFFEVKYNPNKNTQANNDKIGKWQFSNFWARGNGINDEIIRKTLYRSRFSPFPSSNGLDLTSGDVGQKLQEFSDRLKQAIAGELRYIKDCSDFTAYRANNHITSVTDPLTLADELNDYDGGCFSQMTFSERIHCVKKLAEGHNGHLLFRRVPYFTTPNISNNTLARCR